MALVALDVDEPQVVIDDGSGSWTRHVLLRRLRDAEWVTVSGLGVVRLVNLGSCKLVPLARGTAVDSIAGNVDMVDDAVIGQLNVHHATAARLATILGSDPGAGLAPAGTGTSWRVADTSAAEFGQAVPADVVAHGVTRGAVGLAR
jgi:hypothetical protein